MKVLFIILLIFGLVSAWSADDYEIFKLNDKVRQVLGSDVTFYNWLNLPNGPKSTALEIKKSYRKLSKTLHPDKLSFNSNAARKKAEEKYAMLSSVNNILRDISRKERYDYFLDKGFPTWKGTGYLYSKFRPGLLLTVLVVYILVSILHYFALKINRRQSFKRIADYKNQIKSQAWGGSIVPPSDGSDRKLFNEVNNTSFVVKGSGDVYVENDDGLHLIDEYDINVNPTFKDTLIFKIPAGLYNLTLGKVLTPVDTAVTYKKPHSKPQEEDQEVEQVKKKKSKGKKMELPNGKVVYSRKK
ncbi:hypothetical protein CANMA_003417 [Candida margitis]|uniref:uncharacterized protein n=1 Tax=Candida margitis TaxID=1775924 RepID=UPI002226E34D|nr:uncharacterized protein CANMA_003417 [Candida margitis]KAI5965421.1 hypothetical protein CANMA_003417 [Candida margitis]